MTLPFPFDDSGVPPASHRWRCPVLGFLLRLPSAGLRRRVCDDPCPRNIPEDGSALFGAHRIAVGIVIEIGAVRRRTTTSWTGGSTSRAGARISGTGAGISRGRPVIAGTRAIVGRRRPVQAGSWAVIAGSRAVIAGSWAVVITARHRKRQSYGCGKMNEPAHCLNSESGRQTGLGPT